MEDIVENEMTIEVTYVEVEGIKEAVAGFDVSHADGGYVLNFNLEKSGELVKSLAGKFIEQTPVNLMISEGVNSLSFSGAVINAMYGFKSFSIFVTDKPVSA